MSVLSDVTSNSDNEYITTGDTRVNIICLSVGIVEVLRGC